MAELPDFAALNDALTTLFADLLGIPCQWRDQPQQMVVGDSATLDTLGDRGLGVDDARYVEVGSPATGVQASVGGQREVTVQVTVWTESQRYGLNAHQYLDRLRKRLRFPTVLERLETLELGLVTINPVVVVDPIQDGRVRGQASMDVVMSYWSESDDAEVPFIERVRLRSTIKNAAGTTLGDAVQVDQDITIPSPE